MFHVKHRIRIGIRKNRKQKGGNRGGFKLPAHSVIDLVNSKGTGQPKERNLGGKQRIKQKIKQ